MGNDKLNEDDFYAFHLAAITGIQSQKEGAKKTGKDFSNFTENDIENSNYHKYHIDDSSTESTESEDVRVKFD